MKLQGTIRRALALLLVFIFAMSNMGLAEMAEQVSQIIEAPVAEEPVAEAPVDEPADEPVVEPANDTSEPVVEAEVVEEADSDSTVVEPDDAETEAGGGAPVEEAPEEQAPNLDAPVESDAPNLIEPADNAPTVEAEAPTIVAEPAVTVAVEQADDFTLRATAVVENYDGEVAYAWERVNSAEYSALIVSDPAAANGLWSAIDGETADTYVTDAADRFDYSYRVQAIAGPATAASKPIHFKAPEPAAEEVALMSTDAGIMMIAEQNSHQETPSSTTKCTGEQDHVWNADPIKVGATGETNYLPNETGHYYKCTVDGAYSDQVDHTTKLTENGYCEACGYVKATAAFDKASIEVAVGMSDVDLPNVNLTDNSDKGLIAGDAITYQSSSNLVAVDNKKISVTGKPDGGTATITATVPVKKSGGDDTGCTVTATLTVNVKEQPTKLTLSGAESGVLFAGDSVKLTVNVEPDGAYTDGLKWTLEDNGENAYLEFSEPESTDGKTQVTVKAKDVLTDNSPVGTKVKVRVTAADAPACQPVTAEFDVLKKLEESSFSFDGAVNDLAQGKDVTLKVKGDSTVIEDSRYITGWSVEANTENQDVTVGNFITVNNGLVTALPQTGEESTIKMAAGYKFDVKATVTTQKDTTKDVTQTITLHPVPVGVEILLDNSADGKALPAEVLTNKPLKLLAKLKGPEVGDQEITPYGGKIDKWEVKLGNAAVENIATDNTANTKFECTPETAGALTIKVTATDPALFSGTKTIQVRPAAAHVTGLTSDSETTKFFVGSDKEIEVILTATADGIIESDDKLTWKLSKKDAEGDTWNAEVGEGVKIEKVDGHPEQQKLTISSSTATKPESYKVEVNVAGDETAKQTFEFTVQKQLTATDVSKKLDVPATMPQNSTDRKAELKLDAAYEGYTVTYSVAAKEDPDCVLANWISINQTSGAITVQAYSARKNNAVPNGGKKFTVTAAVDGCPEATVSKDITVFAVPTKITLSDGEDTQDTGRSILVSGSSDPTLKLNEVTIFATVAKNQYTGSLKWTVSDDKNKYVTYSDAQQGAVELKLTVRGDVTESTPKTDPVTVTVTAEGYPNVSATWPVHVLKKPTADDAAGATIAVDADIAQLKNKNNEISVTINNLKDDRYPVIWSVKADHGETVTDVTKWVKVAPFSLDTHTGTLTALPYDESNNKIKTTTGESFTVSAALAGVEDATVSAKTVLKPVPASVEIKTDKDAKVPENVPIAPIALKANPVGPDNDGGVVTPYCHAVTWTVKKVVGESETDLPTRQVALSSDGGFTCTITPTEACKLKVIATTDTEVASDPQIINVQAATKTLIVSEAEKKTTYVIKSSSAGGPNTEKLELTATLTEHAYEGDIEWSLDENGAAYLTFGEEPTTGKTTVTLEQNTDDLSIFTPVDATVTAKSGRVMGTYKIQLQPVLTGKVLKDDALTVPDEMAQNSTAAVTFKRPVSAALADAYKIGYKIIDGSNSVPVAEEDISKYVTFDSATMTLQAPAKTEANTITVEDGLKFTLVAYVVGQEEAQKAEKTFTLRPAPVGVKVVMGESDPVPHGMIKDQKITLKATLVGPKDTGDGETEVKPYGSLTWKVTGTPAKGVTGAIFEGSEDKDANTYTITAKKAGKLTVEVTPNAGEKSTFEILLVDETIKAASEDKATCSGKGNVNGQHKWVLQDATEQTDATGHVYKCANGDCGAVSAPVPHEEFVITKGEANVDTENNEVVCKICGYKCTHEGYNADKKAKDAGDGSHTAVCPTCKLTLAETHKIVNHVCTVCGATNIKVVLEKEGPLSLVAGSTDTLKVKMDESVLPDSFTMKFTSNAPKFVEVTNAATGAIRALKAGTATITVSVDYDYTLQGGVKGVATDTVEVTVTPALQSITLDKTAVTLIAGSTTKKEATVTAKLAPVGVVLAEPGIQATTLEDDVVTSAVDGTTIKLTAKDVTETNTDTVTVYYGDKSATIAVTVIPKLESGDVTSALIGAPKKLGQGESDTMTLDPTVTSYAHTVEFTDGEASGANYLSWNEKTGVLTAAAYSSNKKNDVGDNGKDITVTVKFTDFENVTATATVKVVSAPAGVEIQKDSAAIDGNALTLKEDESVTLTAKLAGDKDSSGTGTKTTGGKVTWTSSNPDVLAINTDSDVTITAKKVGTATVTAKTYNGKAAAINVTVSAIKLYKVDAKGGKTELTAGSQLELGAGETAKIAAEILPSGYKPTVTWTPDGATVEQASAQDGAGANEIIINGKAVNTNGTLKAAISGTQVETTLSGIVVKTAPAATDLVITVGKEDKKLAVGESTTLTFGYTEDKGGSYTYEIDPALTYDPVANTITANSTGTATIKMIAWNSTPEKPIEKTETITIPAKIATVALPTAALTLGVGESVTWTLDNEKTDGTSVTFTPKEAEGEITLTPNAYLDVTKEVKDGKTTWTITGKVATGNKVAKQGSISAFVPGTTKAVGSKTGIIVKAAPTAITLNVPEKVDLDKSDTSKLDLTATLTPAGAGGVITWTIDTGKDTEVSFKDAETDPVTGTKVSVVPKKTEGTAVVTAHVYNAYFDPMNDRPEDKELTASVEITLKQALNDGNKSGAIKGVEIQPNKTTLALGETVDLNVEFNTNYSGSVTWHTSEEGKAAKKQIATIDANGILTTKKTGVVTVWPVINGVSFEKENIVGQPVAKKFTILSKIAAVKFDEPATKMSLGETFTFHAHPSKGYGQFGNTPITLAQGADYKNLFTYSITPTTVANIVKAEGDAVTVRTFQTGKFTLIATAVGGKQAKKTVTVGGAKLEEIKFADESVRLTAGESVKLVPVITPANATPALKWTIKKKDEVSKEADVSTLVLDQTGKVTTYLSTRKHPIATAGGKYEITVTADEGNDVDVEPKSDTIELDVLTPPDSNSQMEIIALGKAVGTFGAKYNDAAKTLQSTDLQRGLTIGKGDKVYLAVKYTDDHAGAVTWKTSNKKVVSVNASTGLIAANKPGTVTITAVSKYNSAAYKQLTVIVKDSPKKMITIDPADTKISLGEGETYTVKFNKKVGGQDIYQGTGCWFNITSSNSDIVNVKSVNDGETDVTITVEAKAASGKATVAIQPCYGSATKLTFTVLPKLATVDAGTFAIEPQTDNGEVHIKSATKQTIRLSVPMGSGWGNIKWTVKPNGSDAETVINNVAYKKAAVVTNIAATTFKWISNNTIEISTTAAIAANAQFKVKAETTGYGPGNNKSDEILVKALPSYEASDFGAITTSKKVVGVGERFTAELPLSNESENKGDRGGVITWKAKNAKVVDAYNGVFTASKAGTITLTAMLNGRAIKTGTLTSINTLKSLTPDRKIAKMEKGEKVTLNVAIGGYTPTSSQSRAGIVPDYTGILTAASTDDETISAKLVADDSGNAIVKNGMFELVLEAKDSTYDPDTLLDTPVTVSVTAYNGRTLSMKISVTDELPKYEEISDTTFDFGDVDSELYLPLGDSMQLSEQGKLTMTYRDGDKEAFESKLTGLNINPKYEFVGTPDASGKTDNAAAVQYAKAHTITLANGIVKTGKKTKIGDTVYIRASFEFNGAPYSKVAKLIIMPKTAVGDMWLDAEPAKSVIAVGEEIKASIYFNQGYSNTVTWKTSNKKRATIVDRDAKGELYPNNERVIHGAGKGAVTITATAYSGKKINVSAKLTVVDPPKAIRFPSNAVTTLPGAGKYDYDVELPGYTGEVLTGDAEWDETLYHFSILEEDQTDPTKNEVFEVDPNSGVVTVKDAVTTKGQDVKATLHVETINGYYADLELTALCSSSQITDKTPAAITLGWTEAEEKGDSFTATANGEKATTVSLEEGQDMTAYANVYNTTDKQPENLIPNAPVTWSASLTGGVDEYDDYYNYITLDDSTGHVIADHYTPDGATITITATAVGGTAITAAYKLGILPKLTAENISAELVKADEDDNETKIDKLGVGETATLKLAFAKGATAPEGKTFEVSAPAANLTLTPVPEKTDEWTVTGAAKSSSSKITIKYGDLTKTLTVPVVAAPTAIVVKDAANATVTGKTVTMGEGETIKLTASLTGYTGSALGALTMSVNDEAAGKVTVGPDTDEEGNWTGAWTVVSTSESITETETATVTFTSYNGKTATVTINILPKPTIEITTAPELTDSKTTYGIGETVTLTASLTPDDAYWRNKLAWSSSDPTNAPITINRGVVTVTAKAPAEKVTITAKIDGESPITGTTDLTFQAAPTAADVNSFRISKTTIGVKETAQATIEFEDGKASSYSWKSSKTTVAKVDATGLITGVAAGTAVISAISYDGKTVLGQATITVTKKVANAVEIDLSQMPGGKTTLQQGQTGIISATAKNGTEIVTTDIELTSSDEATVSVTPVKGATNNWTITGVAKGTAILTAKAGDVSSSVLITVSGEEYSETGTEFTVTVTRVLAGKVKQANDTALAASQNNQNAITVSGPDANDVVTISGALADLKAFESSKQEKGTHKWIGLIVDLGSETLDDSLKVTGTEDTFVATTETKEAQEVGGGKNSFVLWLDAEKVATNSRAITLSKTGKVSKTLYFSFKNEAKKELPLTVTKIDPAKFSDEGTKALNHNQFAATVAQSGTTVTVSADMESLETVTESSYVGSGNTGKYIGLVVKTPATDVANQVTIDGAKLASEQTTAALLVDANDSFLIWVKANDEVTSNSYRVEMDGYAPAMLTVEFKDAKPEPLTGITVTKLLPAQVKAEAQTKDSAEWNQKIMTVTQGTLTDGNIDVTIKGPDAELIAYNSGDEEKPWVGVKVKLPEEVVTDENISRLTIDGKGAEFVKAEIAKTKELPTLGSEGSTIVFMLDKTTDASKKVEIVYNTADGKSQKTTLTFKFETVATVEDPYRPSASALTDEVVKKIPQKEDATAVFTANQKLISVKQTGNLVTITKASTPELQSFFANSTMQGVDNAAHKWFGIVLDTKLGADLTAASLSTDGKTNAYDNGEYVAFEQDITDSRAYLEEDGKIILWFAEDRDFSTTPTCRVRVVGNGRDYLLMIHYVKEKA